MGLFGGSKRTSVTETTTNVQNISTGLEDIEGPAIVGDRNVINLSDQGAFRAAEKIAVESLAVGEEIGRTSSAVLRDVSEASFDFGSDALDVVDRATDRALTESLRFGERAFDVAAGARERALEEGFDFGRSSLDFGRSSLDFGRDALDVAGGALGEGLEFGRSALEAVGAAGSRQADTFADALRFSERAGERERAALSEALSFGDTSVERSTDFARGLFGDALQAVGAVVEQGQTQLGNTVTALNAIAREQSTSSDERVADIASSAIRYGLIGFGLLAVGMLALRFAR